MGGEEAMTPTLRKIERDAAYLREFWWSRESHTTARALAESVPYLVAELLELRAVVAGGSVGSEPETKED